MKPKPLQWYAMPNGIPGPKGNQKIKGLLHIVTGRGRYRRVFSFYPSGKLLRSEYLSTISKPDLIKISAPKWGSKMYEVECTGIAIRGLYNGNKKTIVEFTGYEERLSTWVSNLNRSVKLLKSLNQLS